MYQELRRNNPRSPIILDRGSFSSIYFSMVHVVLQSLNLNDTWSRDDFAVEFDYFQKMLLHFLENKENGVLWITCTQEAVPHIYQNTMDRNDWDASSDFMSPNYLRAQMLVSNIICGEFHKYHNFHSFTITTVRQYVPHEALLSLMNSVLSNRLDIMRFFIFESVNISQLYDLSVNKVFALDVYTNGDTDCPPLTLTTIPIGLYIDQKHPHPFNFVRILPHTYSAYPDLIVIPSFHPKKTVRELTVQCYNASGTVTRVQSGTLIAQLIVDSVPN